MEDLIQVNQFKFSVFSLIGESAFEICPKYAPNLGLLWLRRSESYKTWDSKAKQLCVMTVQGKLVNHHAIIDFLSVSMNALGPPNMHSIFLVAWNSFSCASWSCCVWETCPNEADGTCPVGQTVASRWRGCGALWPPRGISDWHPWSIRSSDSTPSSPGRASSSKLENSMEKDHPRPTSATKERKREQYGSEEE